MIHERILILCLPTQDPLGDALKQVAQALNTQVVVNDQGLSCISVDKLFVYAVEPDALDKDMARDMYDLNSNVTLTFEDLTSAEDSSRIVSMRTMLRSVLAVAGRASAGVLVDEDFSPDTIILSFVDGKVTLNQEWDGWALWPELLGDLPQPPPFERLRGRT